MSNPKTRHYAHLASRLRHLNAALEDTENLMGAMANHLVSMQKIGVNTGAQFMAVSRLLDNELREETERAMEEEEAAGAREGQGQ